VRACGWYAVSYAGFIVLGLCWPTAVGVGGRGTQMVIHRCVQHMCGYIQLYISGKDNIFITCSWITHCSWKHRMIC